jgi:hypothetical protein
MNSEANNEMALRYYRAIRKSMDEAANEARIRQRGIAPFPLIRAIGAQSSEEVVP